MTPLAEPEYWIPTADAAKMLGVQRRELQRKRLAYPLQLRARQQRIGRTVHTVYSRQDLLAFQANSKDGIDPGVTERRLRGEETPAEQEAPGLQLVPRGATGDVWGALTRALLQLPGAKPEPKPWMTIAEAAAYLGLPQKYIRDMIASCLLAYIDVGTEGRQWIRIRRRDLDAL